MDEFLKNSLSMELIERISIIALVAYVFSHTAAFRILFKERTTYKEKCILIAFFSSISVAGTFFGIPIEDAIANVRDTGTVVAGLLGGPVVGVSTGIIAGLHRLSLGGFTAVPCAVATIAGGVIAGYIHCKTKPKVPDFVTGVVTGVTVILCSMVAILILSKPFVLAWSLVSQVVIPMSLANAMGIAVFMIITHNAREHQTKIAALQTHHAMRIANAALPYFRQGLNLDSAQNVADTILKMTSATAVAITNRQQVLAHVGAGSDHHNPGPIVTQATHKCLESGQVVVASTILEIGCRVVSCPLKAAIIAPLYCQEEIVGTLKLYYSQENTITSLDVEFANGLSQLFGTQLELAKLQQMAELATKAELKALRAQVNPHFLFNALNTIVSLCRTNPEEARRLIIELSDFFRRSLKSAPDFVSLQEELEHVESYLALEKARFGNRLLVELDIDELTQKILIPTFILQPLVENAVKHGLSAVLSGGTIWISAKILEHQLVIEVKDDGHGIESSMIKRVMSPGVGKGAGVGLSNVNERLKTIYGAPYALKVESQEGHGTIVTITIPVNMQGEEAILG